MTNNFDEFCNTFDIVQNAIQMRTLLRWNGRDLREKENLSEHTHLVVACALKLYDELKLKSLFISENVQFEKMIRLCMVHDSLELLRGDILSITKDTIKGLRQKIDDEENKFFNSKLSEINSITKELVVLADLMACYKFVEYELRYPSNDFAKEVYKSTKDKFDKYYKEFINKYIDYVYEDEKEITYKFVKGYKDDAGIDVVLSEDVTFMPMTTQTIGLNVQVTPDEGEMALLCSRTSAANKGLIVAMCPIDPNYKGEVVAIVHNISNKIIKYNKGEAFCQVITIPFNQNDIKNLLIKKEGKRNDGKLGSTDK